MEKVNAKEAKKGLDLGNQMFPSTMYDRMMSAIGAINMEYLNSVFQGGDAGLLYQFLILYNQIESSDARIKGLLATRYYNVTKQDWMITTPDKNNAEALKAADFVRTNLQALKWKKIAQNILRGRTYGTSILEKVFRKDADGYIRIHSIERIPDSKIEFNAGQKGDTATNPLVNGFGELIIRASDYTTWYWAYDFKNKLVIAQDKDEKGYQDFNGCMRTVARLYIIKTFILKSWAQYVEKTGQPVQIVKMSEDDMKDNKNKAETLLKSIGSNRYGVLFDSMNYEIHTVADTANVDLFERYIDLLNTEIAIAINGQNLTSDVKGGSYAAAQTHKQVLSDITQSDIEFLDEIVNDQIVNHLVAINFPNLPFELYPNFQTVIPETVNLESEARGLAAMAKLVPISKATIYERSGLPMPEKESDTIGGYSQSVLDTL